jgi:large subunit ribosomal protein L13
MDMNKSFVLKKEDRAAKWHIIDAKDQVLGRMATGIADILRGKNKPEFTNHTDGGDYVVVLNCEKIKLTGNKWNDKVYKRYSGYRSGLKIESAKQVFAKDPRRLIEHAVRGMLPKNTLARGVFKKLKVYVGDKHPHAAQV